MTFMKTDVLFKNFNTYDSKSRSANYLRYNQVTLEKIRLEISVEIGASYVEQIHEPRT
jgi:hypothetical protein